MWEGPHSLGAGDDDAAEREEPDPDQVGKGQNTFGAHGAGQQQGERDEGPGADQRQEPPGEQARQLRAPSEGQTQTTDDNALHELDGQHCQRLGDDEAVASERTHAE